MDTFLSLISLSSSSITHSSVLFLPKYTPQEGGFSLQFYQHFGEVSPPHPYAQEAAGICAFVTSMAAKEAGRQSNYIIPKTLTSIIYRTTRTHTASMASIHDSNHDDIPDLCTRHALLTGFYSLASSAWNSLSSTMQ